MTLAPLGEASHHKEFPRIEHLNVLHSKVWAPSLAHKQGFWSFSLMLLATAGIETLKLRIMN